MGKILGKIAHVGGELLQLAAGGAIGFIPGLGPLGLKIGVVAWGIGKILSLFGVRLSIPDQPPVKL